MILTARVRNKAVPTETRDITESADNYETAADAIFGQVPENGWQVLYLRQLEDATESAE